MGYRSEVYYCIEGEKDSIIGALMSFRLKDGKSSIVMDEISVQKTTDDDLAVVFHRESCKWYEGYPDVAVHERFWDHMMETLDDETSNAAGIFLRLGDTSSDIEERSFGEDCHELARISVSMDIDVPPCEPKDDYRTTLEQEPAQLQT